MRMRTTDESVTGECPFLNHDDARCRTRFSLRQIAQTFDFCRDRYRACPVYYTLQHEDRSADLPLVAEVGIGAGAHDQPALLPGMELPGTVRLTINGREVTAGHAA